MSSYVDMICAMELKRMGNLSPQRTLLVVVVSSSIVHVVALRRHTPPRDLRGRSPDSADIGIPNGPAEDGTRGLLKAHDPKK